MEAAELKFKEEYYGSTTQLTGYECQQNVRNHIEQTVKIF